MSHNADDQEMVLDDLFELPDTDADLFDSEPFTTTNIFCRSFAQQSEPTDIPKFPPAEFALDLATGDSGRSSMVTPATTWGSSQEAETARKRSPSNSGMSYTHTGSVLSPTNGSLKRTSLNDPLNDENKKWKNCDQFQDKFENIPIVIQAESLKPTSASVFPSMTRERLPNYMIRTVTYGSKFEKGDERGSINGSGRNSVNGVSRNLFGTSQPISGNNTNHIGQVIVNSTSQGGVQSYGGKCSPKTSNALQNALKKHGGDNLISKGSPKSAPVSNGSKCTELSIEEEKKRKQQEKNRQYAKESRERKNEKLKTLEQVNKEKLAEIEILRKLITHQYVKQNGSEPQWITKTIEWFSSNSSGNSQSSVIVTPCLPNDEELLKELGNSLYGSVLSPVKSSPPTFKHETKMNASSGEARSNTPFTSGKVGELNAFPGSAASHLKIPSARAPSQPVHIPRTTNGFKRRSEASLPTLDAEESVPAVNDLSAHRREDMYTVGLFSGHRTEVRPHKKLEEQFLTPWSASFPDPSLDMLEEEVMTLPDEDTRSTADTVGTSPDALIDEFRNLPSWDLMRIVEEAQLGNDNI